MRTTPILVSAVFVAMTAIGCSSADPQDETVSADEAVTTHYKNPSAGFTD